MEIHFRCLSCAVSLVLLLGLLGGCASSGGSSGGEEVEIVTVEVGSLVASTAATGVVRPRAEVNLTFEVSGQVSQVLVGEGERVRQGQLLARLETADLELKVESAEAALAAAQAQFEQLRAGPRPEEIAAAEAQVRAAEASLSQAIAQRDQLKAGLAEADIAAAEAQVASAIAQQKVAQDTYDRMVRCYTVPLPSGEEEEVCPTLGPLEEEARYSLHAANEALAAAQKQLDALRAGTGDRIRAAEAAVLAAMAQRDIAKAQLDMLLAGPTEAELAAAEANVKQAQAAMDAALLALAKATLVAPFDGVVARVNVEPGEFVGPQMPVILLVDDSQFTIEADVDEADIGMVEVGQEAQITLDAFPGRGLVGRVAVIAPSATLDMGVVSYRVTIEIGPTDLPLRGGMTANVEIVRERREGVLLVPNRAIWIDSETGQPFVEKLVNGEPVVTVIKQGMANEQFSEVLDGLQAGDQLLVRSASVRERFREAVTMPMLGGGSE